LQPWMCTREGSFQASNFYLKHVKAGHCRAIQLFVLPDSSPIFKLLANKLHRKEIIVLLGNGLP
jgi:hypothetical protein